MGALNRQWQTLPSHGDAWPALSTPSVTLAKKNERNRTITLGEPEIDHCCSILLRFITEAMNCKRW